MNKFRIKSLTLERNYGFDKPIQYTCYDTHSKKLHKLHKNLFVKIQSKFQNYYKINHSASSRTAKVVLVGRMGGGGGDNYLE